MMALVAVVLAKRRKEKAVRQQPASSTEILEPDCEESRESERDMNLGEALRYWRKRGMD